MDTFAAMGTALAQLFQPWSLLALAVGVVIGLISGALPGATLPGLIVLISFAYTMDPTIAIPLAIGMLAPVNTSDTLPAVLLGVPGSVSSQATILDGHQLARQGRAGYALAAAYFASMIGGVLGAVILGLIIPLAREVINLFASPEYLMMGLLGIAVVALVSSGAVFKGLMAGTLGMAIATVGTDQAYMVERFTFGVPYLLDGASLIIVVIGIFAIPELIGLVISNTTISRVEYDALAESVNRGRREGMLVVLQHKFLLARSVFLGVIVGILPGIGQSMVQWLTYGSAKATEKGADKTFGTGDIRGVIAPEAANNTDTACGFIPSLAVGIPGGVGQAVFLGFLIVMGIIPGPAMLNERLDLIFLIVYALVLANVLSTGVMLFLSQQVAKVVFIRPHVLVPVVMAVLVVASFTATNSLLDLVALVVATVVGWHMKRNGWPRPPLIIGLVLGPLLEKYFNLSMGAYGPEGIVARPAMWGILAMAVAMVFYSLWLDRQARRAVLEDVQAAAVPVRIGGGD